MKLTMMKQMRAAVADMNKGDKFVVSDLVNLTDWKAATPAIRKQLAQAAKSGMIGNTSKIGKRVSKTDTQGREVILYAKN